MLAARPGPACRHGTPAPPLLRRSSKWWPGWVDVGRRVRAAIGVGGRLGRGDAGGRAGGAHAERPPRIAAETDDPSGSVDLLGRQHPVVGAVEDVEPIAVP